MKVLYTFDESKTNCLARWPHLVDVQTAYLDENTQIGVIELKTCIQAIVSARCAPPPPPPPLPFRQPASDSDSPHNAALSWWPS